MLLTQNSQDIKKKIFNPFSKLRSSLNKGIKLQISAPPPSPVEGQIWKILNFNFRNSYTPLGGLPLTLRTMALKAEQTESRRVFCRVYSPSISQAAKLCSLRGPPVVRRRKRLSENRHEKFSVHPVVFILQGELGGGRGWEWGVLLGRRSDREPEMLRCSTCSNKAVLSDVHTQRETFSLFGLSVLCKTVCGAATWGGGQGGGGHCLNL